MTTLETLSLRLHIDAPKAPERVRVLALFAAESVLAHEGATLPACYYELEPGADPLTSDAAVVGALERANAAARTILAQNGVKASKSCLVLLSAAGAAGTSDSPLKTKE